MEAKELKRIQLRERILAMKDMQIWAIGQELQAVAELEAVEGK